MAFMPDTPGNLKVLWRSSVGAEYAAELADPGHLDIRIETDKDEAARQVRGVRVLVDGAPTENLLDGPDLRHVIVPYVGVRDSLREGVLARPHLRLYNSHFNDAFVAQHAAALLLACANLILEGDRTMRGRAWQPHAENGLESVFLPGKTCLLLGYGAIGRELKPRLEGLGLTLSALRRNPDPAGELREYGSDELHAALAEADVILVSLPSTPATKNMLDAEAFAVCKSDAILVNVGRGDVINQQALYNALKSGQLRSAGLDVWWNYPKEDQATYPADVPLHKLDNVVMSPHRAANYRDWQRSSAEDVFKTLSAIRDGGERNRVDPQKGY